MLAVIEARNSVAQITAHANGMIEYPDIIDMKNKHTESAKYFAALFLSSAPENARRRCGCLTE